VAVGPVEDRMFKFMGAAGSVAELSKSFDFRFVDAKNEPSFRLELTPRTPGVRRRVRQINLWIDKQSYLTRTFEYVERNGDRTRYEFQDVRVNAPIPADRFTLNLPPGVRVER
jgi:outer membrane lipoprotein-sorting protein